MPATPSLSSTAGTLLISASAPTVVPSTVVPSSTYGDWAINGMTLQTLGPAVQFILRLVKCQVPPNAVSGGVVNSPVDTPTTLFVPDIAAAALTDPASSTLLSSLTAAIVAYGNAKQLF